MTDNLDALLAQRRAERARESKWSRTNHGHLFRRWQGWLVIVFQQSGGWHWQMTRGRQTLHSQLWYATEEAAVKGVQMARTSGRIKGE
jgi:hypothetical protein